MEAEKKFKYHFAGQGYNSKRALSHGMTEEFLSEYGMQLKQQMMDKAVMQVKSHNTLTDKEANRKVFFGFSSNATKSPNSDLREVAIATNEGDYIYMEAFQFSIGGSIISLGKEKLNEKTLKGGIENLSIPTSQIKEPNVNIEVAEEETPVPETVPPMRAISDDFRARD